ncbi:MAG: hypothetical protein JZU65_20470, partial [Chlorobium sp.]|nr:hypothetical protein [Chlorobium sp.]
MLRTQPKIAARRLRHPCPTPPPPDPLLASIHATALLNDLSPLFNLHLLSTLALSGSNRLKPGETILSAITTLLPDIPLEDILRGQWLCLPVLTCQQTTSTITWFMLGLIPGLTDITLTGSPLPDVTSRTTINAALAAVCRGSSLAGTGFIACPLQNQNEPPVTGGSLGLPFALGMQLLQERRPWPDKVYASGGIGEDGRILA